MLQKLRHAFPDRFIDDLTDPNDSVCFTLYLADASNPYRLGSAELHRYLDAGNIAHYIKVQLSRIHPALCLQFCRHPASRTQLYTSDAPFTVQQRDMQARLLAFAEENALCVKSYTEWAAVGAYARYFEPENA